MIHINCHPKLRKICIHLLKINIYIFEAYRNTNIIYILVRHIVPYKKCPIMHEVQVLGRSGLEQVAQGNVQVWHVLYKVEPYFPAGQFK